MSPHSSSWHRASHTVYTQSMFSDCSKDNSKSHRESAFKQVVDTFSSRPLCNQRHRPWLLLGVIKIIRSHPWCLFKVQILGTHLKVGFCRSGTGTRNLYFIIYFILFMFVHLLLRER